MRIILLGIVLGLFFLLAACSNVTQGPTEEPSEVDSATPTAPALETDTPDEVGYPAPGSEESYPEPAEQEGYPPPSAPVPTRDPYPGGVAFIEHPAGLQCEDPNYPDLRSAEAALEEAGIEIQSAEAVELVVCQACGCPTSLHYRISIDPADLNTALSLGWQRGS
ncbi:MAG: hypothetical protein PVH03_10285 [Chloroflexota bacterium]